MRSPIATCCIALASIALLALASAAAAAPPTVSTGAASEMTEDSVTLNGTVNPGGLKTKYYFEYGKTTSYGTKTSEGSLEGGSQSVNKGLTGLTFGILYHYRLVATNSEGTAKGADRVFTLRWAIQSMPNPKEEESLSGVSCTSTSTCMAVRKTFGPKAVSWNGTEWKAQSVPAEAGGLADVSCTSSTACVAVGNNSMLSVHWNGTEWKTQEMAEPGGETFIEFKAVSCTSSTSCTAVGEYFEGGETKPLAEQWNGTEWKLQSVPSPESSKTALLKGVSCTSATECAAVGFYYYGAPSTYRAYAARWNGTEWKLQTVPFPKEGNRYLEGVSCTSSTNCIAVGFDFVNGEPMKYTTLAVHWNGTEWKVQSTPNPEGSYELTLTGVSCTSSNACIATGSYASSGHKVLSLRWNGTEWQIQSAPEPVGALDEYIYDVSCTFSTACTTVGDYRISGGASVGFALRYFKTAASPTVTTKSATGVVETGATLQGTVNPNGPPAEYHFEYGTTIAYGSSTETVSAGSGESVVEVSKEISGLKPSTEYHYRIVASNENPKTSNGSDSTFTTLGPPIVTTGSAEPDFETGESAKLNATINPRGFSTTYQFEYGTSEGSYTTKVPVSPKSIGGGTSDQKVNETITGLTPGTRYYYRATASNSAGATNGKESSFLAPDTPEATTLEATGVGGSSAQLTGELITRGSKVKYRFEYGTTKAYGSEVPYPAEEIGPTPEKRIVEASAEKLKPLTTYHYRIVAESPMGNAYGEDETFTTLEVEVPTVLCATHESETCESPAETFTMSLAEGTSWKLLTGLYTILCLNVSSTVEPLELGGPQVLHVSELSITGCGTSSGHNNCSVTTEELPLLNLLRTELDRGVISVESGSIRLQCAGLGLDCKYGFTGLELEIEGGNPMMLFSEEMPLEETGGKFFCPGETVLDSTLVSSQELHVLK